MLKQVNQGVERVRIDYLDTKGEHALMIDLIKHGILIYEMIYLVFRAYLEILF